MKVIVSGATGFLGTEVLRQALSNPAITSLIALGRRKTALPEGLDADANIAKFKAVVCEDFENYSEGVKKQLEGADCCIWLLAITPGKYRTMEWEDVRRICLDYTKTGIETISRLSSGTSTKPFRFLYVSGANATRDASQRPWLLPEYSIMRASCPFSSPPSPISHLPSLSSSRTNPSLTHAQGEVENQVLDFARASNGQTVVSISKPGLIFAPGVLSSSLGALQVGIPSLPVVGVGEMAATLVDQATRGFEKETLENGDLVRIGAAARRARVNRE